MLNIQVLGKGLIPRGMGIAPRKEPFPADLNTIKMILATGGLKPVMIHPEDHHTVTITRHNVDKLWKSYSNYKPTEKKEATPVTAPSVPEKEAASEQTTAPAAAPVAQPVAKEVKPVETPKPEVKQEVKTEPAKTEQPKVEQKVETAPKAEVKEEPKKEEAKTEEKPAEETKTEDNTNKSQVFKPVHTAK